jgi:hypothetical protein
MRYAVPSIQGRSSSCPVHSAHGQSCITATKDNPDAVKALTTAYEHACAALDLADRTDPLKDIIAQKIIERAKRGELDAVRLCEAVLEELRSNR